MLSQGVQRRLLVSLFLYFLLAGASTAQRFTEMPSSGIEGAYPLSLDWADFDNDGDLDLAVGEFYDRADMALYSQTAPFQFQYVGGTLPQAKMAIWGDYNGDGWLDFVSTRIGAWPQWDSWIY